jgi:hypothetical protein
MVAVGAERRVTFTRSVTKSIREALLPADTCSNSNSATNSPSGSDFLCVYGASKGPV